MDIFKRMQAERQQQPLSKNVQLFSRIYVIAIRYTCSSKTWILELLLRKTRDKVQFV